MKKVFLLFLTAFLTASISACGGGGSLYDAQGQLMVTPAKIEVKGASSTTCYSGQGPIFYIFGGKAPYTLRNSLPNGMSINKTTVYEQGGGVMVNFNGSCITNLPIVVTDDEGVTVNVEISNVFGQ